MGTPEFAVSSLEILVEHGYNVVAVITAPDKPAGRGLKLVPSAVKEAALKHGIPVLQPEKLKNPEFLETLRSYNADLQIVVAFRMLPELVWNMPAKGTFNLHASLLPDYRGAAPINWAIMNGETETGVSTFFLQHEIDTGDLILQEKEPVHPDDNVGTLYERLMKLGADLVLRTVKAIDAGTVQPVPQRQSAEPKLAPKLFRENCEADFNRTSAELVNFVRGLSPYPGAWANINGKIYKLLKISAVFDAAISAEAPAGQGSNAPVGSTLSDGKTYIHIKTGDGFISLDEFVPEGKKSMNAKTFLAGNKI